MKSVITVIFMLISISFGTVNKDLFLETLYSNDSEWKKIAAQDFYYNECTVDTLSQSEESELKRFILTGNLSERIIATRLLHTLEPKTYYNFSKELAECIPQVQLTGYLPYLHDISSWKKTPSFDTTLFTNIYTTTLFSKKIPLWVQEVVFDDVPWKELDPKRFIPFLINSRSNRLRKDCIYILSDIPKINRAQYALYFKSESDSVKRQSVIDECKEIEQFIEVATTTLKHFVVTDTVPTLQLMALKGLVKLDSVSPKELKVARKYLLSDKRILSSAACGIVGSLKDTLSLPILAGLFPKTPKAYTYKNKYLFLALSKILDLPCNLNSRGHYHVTFPEQFYTVKQCDWNKNESILHCEYNQAIKLIEWWNVQKLKQ